MAEELKPDAPAPTTARDPLSAFRSELDRMVDSFFGVRGGVSSGAPLAAPWGAAGSAVGSAPGPAGGLFGAALSPSVDLTESETALTLTAELPGLGEHDVELSLQNGVLTLSGEKKQESAADQGDLYVAERRYGAFRRSFRLPDSVDPEKVSARFEQGVLTVTLPKRADIVAGAKKIAITKS